MISTCSNRCEENRSSSYTSRSNASHAQARQDGKKKGRDAFVTPFLLDVTETMDSWGVVC